MSNPGKTTTNGAAFVAAQIALICFLFITGIHAWHSDHRHLYGNASGGFIQERARVGASFVNLGKTLLGGNGIYGGFIQGATNGHTGLADVNPVTGAAHHPILHCLNWEPLTLCAQKSSLACLDSGKNHLALSCFHDTCGEFTPWSACISNVQFRFRPDCKGHIIEYQNCVGTSLNDERLARRLVLEKEKKEALKKEAELARQKLAQQAEEDRKAIARRDAEDKRLREEYNRLVREKAKRDAAEKARLDKEAEERAKREAAEKLKREQEEAERAKREADEKAQKEKEAAEQAQREAEEEEKRKLEQAEAERAKKLEEEAAEKARLETEAAEKLKREQEEAERAQREKEALKEIEDSTLILEEGMEDNEPELELENVQQPQEQEEQVPIEEVEQEQQLPEPSVETPVLPPVTEGTVAANVNELPQQQAAAGGEHKNEETQNESDDEKSHYNAKSMTKQASVGLAAIASAFVGTYIYTKGSRRAQNLGADDAGFDDGDYNLQDEEVDLEAKIQLEDNFWGENDDA